MKYIVVRETTLQNKVGIESSDTLPKHYWEATQYLLNHLKCCYIYDVGSAKEFLDEIIEPYIDELSGTYYYDNVTPAVVEQYAALCVAKEREKLKLEKCKYWTLGFLTGGIVAAILVYFL